MLAVRKVTHVMLNYLKNIYSNEIKNTKLHSTTLAAQQDPTIS